MKNSATANQVPKINIWVQILLIIAIVMLTKHLIQQYKTMIFKVTNISVFKHKEGQAKANYVKKLHEKVKAKIEKRNESYAR